MHLQWTSEEEDYDYSEEEFKKFEDEKIDDIRDKFSKGKILIICDYFDEKFNLCSSWDKKNAKLLPADVIKLLMDKIKIYFKGKKFEKRV